MEGPMVNVKEGALMGRIEKSKRGTKYYNFSGIPYAKPPVGELRFKDPVPFDTWIGTRDATKEGSISIQHGMFDDKCSGEDDSLFVNIFTPKVNSNQLLPVIVWIHGGGFTVGSANVELFSPEFFLDRNVVFASMNYRLGVMGFLCTDADNARGDMGLKDQCLAMKWIKSNIVSFSGDPGNITIIGNSAGAASVEYHMLSPMSRGLFAKAIMQSGSAFNTWARNPNPLKHTRKLAKVLGYNSDDDAGLFKFINGFDSETLVKASSNLLDMDDLKDGLYLPFVPSINVFKDGKGFINEEPINILKSGRFAKVPTISGVCNKEGIFIQEFYKNFESECYYIHEDNFGEFISKRLNNNFKGGNDRLNNIYRKTPNDRNQMENIIDIIGDIGMENGCFYSLEQRLEHFDENQYFYNFLHEGNLEFFTFKGFDGKTLQGASHCDELPYLGTIDAVKATPSAIDSKVRSQMVDMWCNFVKTGDPSPNNNPKIQWPQVTKDEFRYLELNEKFQVKTELKEERRALWREIYSTY